MYMWTLGYLAASWLENNPLAVMAIGFLAGMVVGLVCDLAMRALTRRR